MAAARYFAKSKEALRIPVRSAGAKAPTPCSSTIQKEKSLGICSRSSDARANNIINKTIAQRGGQKT
jgi:hypothetical protein